jgi:hypothetical protein
VRINDKLILVYWAFLLLYSRIHFNRWFNLQGFPQPAEVDKSGWGYGWEEICTLSFLEGPGSCYLSSDGTLKMRIRFVQFAGIVECKKGKDEELMELKVKTGDKILQSVGMLLQSQALSDLKIKTSDGKVFLAHKIILGGS